MTVPRIVSLAQLRLAVLEHTVPVTIVSKILITGGPKTGKTTLAHEYNYPNTIHTDDYQHLSWSDQPQQIIQDASQYDSWLIEGVQGPRLLRKGLRPDLVIWLSKPFTNRTKQQLALAKGIHKIFLKWLSQKPENVKVEYK